jgi:excisionase family DNA binding protein
MEKSLPPQLWRRLFIKELVALGGIPPAGDALGLAATPGTQYKGGAGFASGNRRQTDLNLRFSQGSGIMAGAVEQMLREVMDIRQAADYLGISADTLYRYASEGTVPAFRLGNRWRFKRSLLDAWMVKMSSPKAPSNVTVMPREKKPAARAR